MKKIFGLTGLVCMFLAYSCARDTSFDGWRGSSPLLSVTVDLDRLGSESAARASVAPEEGEETVSALYLYFFEASDDHSGLLVDCIEMEGPLSMSSKYAVPTQGTKVSAADAYNIIAVANIGDNRYIPGSVEFWNGQWHDRSESYFRTHALAEIAGTTIETDNTKAIASDWIPMHGTTAKKEMSGDISVVLTRNVARFDVINSVSASYDLLRVSIWNAYTRSSVTGDGVLDYSRTEGLHTERFYGVDNVEIEGTGYYGNIKGRLYAFENKVVSPEAGDRYTTCLIVGLKNRDSGRVGYYRVNIHPEDSPQNLKRNNVYRLTVTGVTGEGADTEADAYAKTKNELVYVINHWDLDDNGLIVSDQHSILAMPVKTIRIGAGGGEYSCTITTFSTLPSPSPLSIRSQIYNPPTNDIRTSLSGNILTVYAERLDPGDADRTGLVTVTYAGLEASVKIIQSSSVDAYLDVTLEDTWSPTLGSPGGLRSEYIYVNASGPWTVELFGEGFTLDPAAGNAVTLLKSASPLLANGKFNVYTHTPNDTDEVRKGFVLISLDEDPVNHIAVVPIYQKPPSAININPEADLIVFDGHGALISHPEGTTFTVSVSPGQTLVSCVLTDGDTDKFSVSMNTGGSTGTLSVSTNQVNTSGEAYTAMLLIKDTDNDEKYITLRQESSSVVMLPSSFATIPVTGGETGLISLSTGDPGSQWTATIRTETTSPGKTLCNHEAYFVDENGTRLDVFQPQAITRIFRIVFPKVYFPNRDMNITATVTINVAGGSLTRTFTVSQSALTAREVNIWNSRSASYGALGNHYYMGYTDALTALGYSWTNGDDKNGGADPPVNVNYIHMGSQHMTKDFNWSKIEKFRTEKDGILMLMSDEYGEHPLAGVNSISSPLRKNGYFVASGLLSGNNARLSSEIKNTRVGLFLTTYGATALDPASITSSFSMNSVHTELTSWPQSAVPVVVNGSDHNKVIMAIDPENKLVFLGECEIFHDNNALTGNRRVFMNNYIQYVINTAKYGSHFTDMLREDLKYEVPAMWDDIWGENKWPY